MRHLRYLFSASFVILAVAGCALAHGKVGLWNVTVVTKLNIDTSHMSPNVQAQLRQMGMLGDKGLTMRGQHCMTVAEVAINDLSATARNQKTCKLVHSTSSGSTMSGDLVCDGDFKGQGHMQFTFDRDTHYVGHMTMTGSRDGKPSSTDMSFEGNWVKADCGQVKT